MIKVTLALEKGQIPPTIGIKRVNPKIKLQEWNMRIVAQNTEWPGYHASRVRRAGISAFGYGGANAHIILESYLPQCDCYFNTTLKRTMFLLPFSANSKVSLEKILSCLSSEILKSAKVSDLAYTLARRSQLPVRGYLCTNDPLTEDIRAEQVRSHEEKRDYSRLPIAFIFTGQGAQWPQMAFELLTEFPSFRHSIQELDAVLASLPEAPTWTIEGAVVQKDFEVLCSFSLGVISEPAAISTIHLPSRSQPVCTAIQIALVKLLSKWNVKPEVVMGHSSGLI